MTTQNSAMGDEEQLKYAAIYTDENAISTEFCNTEQQAWQELIEASGETRESLESAYYVESFTKQQIDNIPEVDL